MDHETLTLGVELVRDGWIKQMREATGISRSHVAKMLGCPNDSVTRWERGWRDGENHWLSMHAAKRIVLLHQHYVEASEWLAEEGLSWDDMVPLHLAAMKLGCSVGMLEHMIIRRRLEPIDLGMMGKWLTVQEVELCRGL